MAEFPKRPPRGGHRRWKGTDILINNAGVAAGGLVGEILMANWEWILRINLWGVIHGCHVFVPKMKNQNKKEETRMELSFPSPTVRMYGRQNAPTPLGISRH